MKYLTHEIINTDDGYTLYHWMKSEDMPNVAGRGEVGTFATYEEAEQVHYREVMLARFNIKQE